jgi:hypothetical protein
MRLMAIIGTIIVTLGVVGLIYRGKNMPPVKAKV